MNAKELRKQFLDAKSEQQKGHARTMRDLNEKALPPVAVDDIDMSWIEKENEQLFEKMRYKAVSPLDKLIKELQRAIASYR